MENCNQASSITAKRNDDFFNPRAPRPPRQKLAEPVSFVPPQRFFGMERLGNHMMLIPFRSTAAGGQCGGERGMGGGRGGCDVC